MRKITFLFFCLLLSTMVFGCSGGGGDSSTPSTPPTSPNAPMASFTADNDDKSVVVGTTVRLTDTSTKAVPTWWKWSEDGIEIGTSQNLAYVPSTVGNHTIKFISGNAAGSSEATKVIVVTAAPVVIDPPVAGITTSATTIAAGESVQFTDASTGANSLSWTFGDGATSTERSPSHTYVNSGTFTASQTAVNEGGTDTESVMITVTEPAPVVNGIEGQKITIDNTQFIVTLRNGNVYLTAIKQDSSKTEETILATADLDECHDIFPMNGFLYLYCVQDAPVNGLPLPTNTGAISLIKVDTATNTKVATFNVAAYGAPIASNGESVSDTMYLAYANVSGVDTLTRLTSDGTILYSTQDNPGGTGEQFTGPIIIGSDGVFMISIKMKVPSASNNRVHVIKYAFDLKSRMATTITDEYRPFDISDGLDSPTEATFSADGATLNVYATIEAFSASSRNVLLKFNATTLKFISETILPGNGV